jgi:hypothetical protein
LWWVEHADLKDPQPDEFVMPPHVNGAAGAQGAQEEPDLDYEFEGVELAVTDQYFAVTAGLTFKFIENGESTPLISRSSEPVEVETGAELPA